VIEIVVIAGVDSILITHFFIPSVLLLVKQSANLALLFAKMPTNPTRPFKLRVAFDPTRIGGRQYHFSGE
jgi:hypothetical protein